ncbi:hypothetical protein, partial [Fusobacterium ulcerans]|uniref:hypothetical protein n=1 Tax=Fusobacterium ulcerans TaxID=861 RepID=UPI001C9C356B
PLASKELDFPLPMGRGGLTNLYIKTPIKEDRKRIDIPPFSRQLFFASNLQRGWHKKKFPPLFYIF